MEEKERQKRIQKAEKKKQNLLTNMKINKIMREIPEEDRLKIIEEESRERRLELKEAKENIWKRWRIDSNRREKNENILRKEDKTKILEKLERVMEKIEKEKVEEKKRKEERAKIAESKNEKRMERKRKQRMLEEKWEMMRWITEYIDQNQERWEVQGKERRKEFKQKLDDWDKRDRLEKVKRLKEVFNLEASCQEDLEAKCQTDLEAGMPGNIPVSSQRSAEENVDLEATLPGKELFRKVSDFPVPQRPTKLRGAELVKAIFLKRMDKTFFSIMRLQDSREEREHPEASMPSEYKDLGMLKRWHACQPLG